MHCVSVLKHSSLCINWHSCRLQHRKSEIFLTQAWSDCSSLRRRPLHSPYQQSVHCWRVGESDTISYEHDQSPHKSHEWERAEFQYAGVCCIAFCQWFLNYGSGPKVGSQGISFGSWKIKTHWKKKYLFKIITTLIRSSIYQLDATRMHLLEKNETFT